MRSSLNCRIFLFHYSQGAERTQVHVYLPYRGAILFYVYIAPLGRSDFLWAPANTFLFKLPYNKLLLSRKVKFQIQF